MGSWTEGTGPARAALEILSRRRGPFALFALAAFLGAGLVTARTTRTWRARATLSIEPPLRNASGLEGFTAVVFDLPRYIGTQQERLRSPAVLAGVLETHRERIAGLPEFAGREGPELLEALARAVSVEARPDTYLVDLFFAASDPREAAAFANDLAEAACREGVERDAERGGAVARLVSEKIVELEGRLAEAEGAVARFQREHDVEAFEEKVTLHAADLGRAVEALTAADLELARREPPFRAVEASRDPEGALSREARVPAVEEDPAVASLEREETLLALEIASKERSLGPNHLDLLGLAGRRSALEERLRESRALAARRIESAWREAEETRGKIASLVEARERALADLGTKRREYETLLARAAEVRELYREFYRRETGALLPGTESPGATQAMRVESIASVPIRPWRPNLPLNFGLAAALALFGGFGLAFLLESMDETVRDRGDLDPFLHVRTLGLVPWVRGARGILFARIADREPQHPAAEAFRGVRTAVFGAAGEGPRRILVTSAGASEGKTSTAVNLAITLAQAGSRTLLLDADLRRPRLHEVFGLPRGPGLVEAVGRGDLSGVRSTEVELLSVLPAGGTVERPTEVLGGEGFRRLLEIASRQFERIVVDSPPAHLLADGRVLAARADATILVAWAGRTRRRALAAVIEGLQALGASVSGIVLNSVSSRSPGYGYGYGYGYGSGKGSGSKGGSRALAGASVS